MQVDERAAVAALTDLGFVHPGPSGTELRLPTSATTGAGRTVRRTVESWVSSFAPFSALTGIDASSAVLVGTPSASSLFAYGLAHARAVGAAVRTLPRWNPGAAAAGDATVAHLTPAMLTGLLDHHDTGLRPPLRTAVVAGAATPDPLRTRAAGHGIEVVDYYGAAELSFVAIRAGGHGLTPFPGVEIELREAVIWVRGPYLALGYLRGQDGPLRCDGDWASVGDRGTWASDGTLLVSGRGEDVVVSGGASVAVEPVEAVLAAVAGVDDVVVLGTPHPYLGQVVTAVIVGDAPIRRLRAAVRAGLPAHHRPRRWYRADALPLTAAGKRSRALLADRIAAGTPGPVPMAETGDPA